ncbi:hypothetical protein Pth03_00050 [Planotetraspora thailandica]|uniref:DUF1015 domain-containing protein n=1 Tax=Planotetraspora thailandica TaxID=487172 RepID=A0A8J3UY45_9ACTN|nr:DUF1015 domain-containing protein [Planotetraspora thailandica]GII51616.1 hypothetical protein Pth03_00050 [Planotetraspora thailandica]
MESSERAGLVLRPFRGVRFAVDDLSAVTSPPYDLISPDDMRDLLARHANNVVRLILPGTGHYGEAREILEQWLTSGVLAVDDVPALYVYEQSATGLMQRGLIGGLGVGSDAVLPHENVMPGPVADRLALMRATEANLEPIFLLYEGGGAASRLVNEVAGERTPLSELTTPDGVRHRLWAVTDPAEIAAAGEDLRDRQALIADGHHRYATYEALRADHQGAGPWDYGLAFLVDSLVYPPDLRAIHRVIPGLPLDEAVARAKGAWQVHEFAALDDALTGLATATGPAFVLAGDGTSHLLTDPDPLQLAHAMPGERSARWRSLDTSVLTSFLMPKVWGIEDSEDAVLVVHHDPQAAVRLARSRGGTAVLLNPLSTVDVLAVAAEGERVPRKSTSFGPKPRTGLVLRVFAAD